MHYYRLSALSVLAVASLAAPLVPRWDDLRVKHTWHTVPSNWENLGPPSSNTTIDLHIALLPQSENALIDALYEVSTPSHPKYGAHLSKKQVARLVAPHRDTLDLVNSWLERYGISRSSISVSHGGGWLTVTAVPVSQANEMLGASYQLYRQSGTNNTSILRTIGYKLPEVLHRHVRTVVPTTYFASTHTPWQSSRRRPVNVTADRASRELGTILSSRVDTNEVMPMDLRWLYKTSAYVPAAMDENTFGVVGYANDFPSPADLTEFMTRFRTDAMDATYEVVKSNGGKYKPGRPTAEGSQNIQYAEAMVYPTPVTFYSGGGHLVITPDTNLPGRGDATMEWLKHVLDQEDVPKTISTSYGDYEQDLPLEYATAICDMYAQLGARGVSVLFPSGNYGVGNGACRSDGDGVRFIPEFPASCPYVTSVGGTMGGTGETDQGSEVAAELSGGGFSNYFERPQYQDEAVPKFLQQLGSQYAGMFHPGGRGIPDVSAQSLNFPFIMHNELFIADGTSFATPTTAGIISLLNDYLLSTDRPPLGFLNPLLYGPLRLAMNDITYGSNPGCNTPGFDAIPGWDPVTGLGTPDFLKLQALRNLIFQE
ncbi:peptidase S8/S53 domain-containing protein [Lactarius quietus]|nr:peptidase S8/S53 domain-containing protein [Lactarius quietus]